MPTFENLSIAVLRFGGTGQCRSVSNLLKVPALLGVATVKQLSPIETHELQGYAYALLVYDSNKITARMDVLDFVCSHMIEKSGQTLILVGDCSGKGPRFPATLEPLLSDHQYYEIDIQDQQACRSLYANVFSTLRSSSSLQVAELGDANFQGFGWNSCVWWIKIGWGHFWGDYRSFCCDRWREDD
jgi:hypothetical protein